MFNGYVDKLEKVLGVRDYELRTTKKIYRRQRHLEFGTVGKIHVASYKQNIENRIFQNSNNLIYKILQVLKLYYYRYV